MDDVQTWRVVDDVGACHVYAIERHGDGGWTVKGRCRFEGGGAATPRQAAVDAAEYDDVAIREILAPGEQSAAEVHAILDGRTTPPTEAEIRAHASAGGGWLFAWDTAAGPTQEVAFHGLTVLEALAHAAELNSLFLALPLGPDRRPCAWPVTP